MTYSEQHHAGSGIDDRPEAPEPLPAHPGNRGDTLGRVRDRGVLRCGLNGLSHGFSLLGEDGNFHGIEADLAHALAAAVLGLRSKVEFEGVTGLERFYRVRGSEPGKPRLDIVLRNTTVTSTRDASKEFGGEGVNFGPPYFHDGLGMLVDTSDLPPNRIDSDSTIADLPTGAKVCTVSEGVFAAAAAAADKVVDIVGLSQLPTPFSLQHASDAGCLVVSIDRSLLASIKETGDPDDNWVLLKQTLTKEPLAPIITDRDDVWSAIVSWCFYALVFAEEQGIRSDNIGDIEANPTDYSGAIRRVFGDFSAVTGSPLGLTPGWARRMIEQVGNYGEIYADNLDEFGLERDGTPNALWANEGGGLIYSPPIR